MAKNKKQQKRIKKQKQKNQKNTALETIQKQKSFNLKDFYYDNYKKLLIIPIFLLILSLLIIGNTIINTGSFVDKSVSLKGGISLTINTNSLEEKIVEKDIKDNFDTNDIVIRNVMSAGEKKAIIIETSSIDRDNLSDFVKSKYSLQSDDMSIEQTGSVLGDRFFRQTGYAIMISLIFMAIVVYLYFKTFIPSLAIMLAAVSDIIMTLAVFNILGMKLTTAGIAAFLMLIGYSVDTDILLSTRVLKRKEDKLKKRIFDALITGFFMNITTLVAITIALFFSRSQVLSQIMTILFIGLIFDMINTWIQNVGILRLYLEKKK